MRVGPKTNSKTGVSVLLIKVSQLNDIFLKTNTNGNLTSKLYDRHDDLIFFYLQLSYLI